MKKKTNILILLLLIGVSLGAALAQSGKSKKPEPGDKKYRILSVSTSTNLVLISDLETKTRLMLDAAQAKVTIDGKASDLKELQRYTLAVFRIQRGVSQMHGIDLDGKIVEIQVETRK